MVNMVIGTALNIGLGYLMRALQPDTVTKSEGQRLGNSQITGASEGTVIPRIWGKFRVGGQLIWATNFREEIVVDRTERGGKGGPKQISEATTYKYYASFAIGICEGDGGARLNRVFIDGAQIDLSRFNYRFYDGSETQNPDPKIVQVEGVGNVPAYRGLCYIVFDEVDLTDFGNRLPQMSVEINMPSSGNLTGTVEGIIRSVEIIPGVGEFAYATEVITKGAGTSASQVVNVNTTKTTTPDIEVSLDQLTVDVPNVSSMSLVVAWFGDTIDATTCELKPKVEETGITTSPRAWRVSDRVRSTADIVTRGGGTPSDLSVRQAFATMKNRGMRVMFNPITILDIPPAPTDRTLPLVNPDASLGLTGWTQNVGTWTAGSGYFSTAGLARGNLSQSIVLFPSDAGANIRVTFESRSVNPRISFPAFRVSFYDTFGALISEGAGEFFDQTTDWNTFTGTFIIPSGAASLEFALEVATVSWGGIGPNDYTIDFDNIVVDTLDGFDGSVAYPWRGRIEGDTTNFIGTVDPSDFGAWNGTNVPYTGPSTEWSHRRMVLHYARLLADLLEPGDAFLIGSDMLGLSETDATWGDKLADLMTDVRTILDPAVLVSYAASWKEYKIADLDPVWSSADFIGINNYLPITDWFDGDEVYTVEAFKAGIDGGEFWDYEYADDAARATGTQTPIVSAALRQKDIKTWATTNYSGTPVWFTEFGCPAMDKGANQPDIFFDLESGEPNVPYRSNGNRNDTVQRLYLQAMIEYWTDDGFVDPTNMFVRCWDIRPFPQFPALTAKWPDGESWVYGHWLNGRLGITTLGQVVDSIMFRAGYGVIDFDTTRLYESGIVIGGMGVFDISTARSILENLMTTYSFNVLESSGAYQFIMRDRSDEVTIVLDDLVMSGDNSFVKSRRQDVELPDRTTVKFLDEVRDYAATTVDGHTVTGNSDSIEDFISNCVLPVGYAQNLADILTQEKWVAKNGISFSLPMNYLRVEPGDAFNFMVDSVSRRYRIESKTVGDQIDIEAVGYAEAVYLTNPFGSSLPGAEVVTPYGSSTVIFAELPVPDDLYPNLWSPRVLVAQRPWPGSVLIFEDDNAGGYLLNSRQSIPAVIGTLKTALPKGLVDQWDVHSTVSVQMDDPIYNLASTTDAAVLNGANTLAVLTPSGEWEVFQFATAALDVDGSYILSRLLRGKLGTEPYMGDPTPIGSRVVVYDAARFGVISGTEDRLNIPFETRYGPAGIDVTDNRYTDEIVTPRGVAYRPWSPVHLRQERIGGDIELSWIRRTRFSGDPWVDGEVPLSEETETYEVVITGGRTITVAGTTSVVYTLAQQVVDFGVGQTSVGWTVYQMSDRFGRGAPANG